MNEGYASHLNVLMAHGGSRPAQGNQRMVIPKGCFNLPGQAPSLRRRRYVLYFQPLAASFMFCVNGEHIVSFL